MSNLRPRSAMFNAGTGPNDAVHPTGLRILMPLHPPCQRICIRRHNTQSEGGSELRAELFFELSDRLSVGDAVRAVHAVEDQMAVEMVVLVLDDPGH